MVPAVTWTAMWVGLAWSQSQHVSAAATVTAKSCHQSIGGDGGSLTACIVDLTYTAPDGTPGTVEFNGVEGTRIHGQNGQETVYIYFSDRSWETPINPQDNVLLRATVVLVMFSLPVGIGGFIYLSRGLRPKRADRAASEPHVVITSTEGDAQRRM
jgi:hypothetical protein